MQRQGGLYSIFDHHAFYTGFQELLVGAARGRREVVREFIRPFPGARILDLGCGPADLLADLGDVDYVGIDSHADYVRTAQKRYGNRGRFLCQDLASAAPPGWRYDRILAIGILHHLDDPSCHRLFQLASQCLNEDGVLFTIDPSFVPRQSWLGRWLTSRDRGRNVRAPAVYEALAREYFREVRVSVRKRLIRLPYTHTLLNCQRARCREGEAHAGAY
jgi:SAM-dependent methyltransferase